MTYRPPPGSGFIFMKVGVHAREPLEEIIARKRQEIADAGVSFWGYGGNTCHPITKVRPFVSRLVGSGQEVYLCMHEMTSSHYAEPVRAAEYSEDGVSWLKVPHGINVRGSRYALALKTIEETDLDLKLAETKVGVGLQAGKSGEDYIQGRVDKACLEMLDVAPSATSPDRVLKVTLAARLVSPYAVLLR